MKKEFGSLKKESDIKRVLSKGKRISAKGLRAAFLANGLGSNRITVAIKKGFGTAVERNRAKRRIKEVLRLELAGAKTSIDAMIFPDMTIKTEDSFGIRREIKGLLSRMNVNT